MRILHTADWHLGRKLEGRSRHEEQVQALDEICRIADDEKVDAVLVAGDVFDTYNPPAEAEALFYRTMTRLANGGRRAVIVIAGNHDSPDRLIASDPYARALGITTIGYPKDIPAVTDNGTEAVSCVESDTSFIRLRMPGGELLSVLALPYPSEARLKEVLTQDIADEAAATYDYNARIRGFMDEIAHRFRPGEANIVASHLFLRGGLESKDSERPIQVGGAYAVDPMSFPEEAGYVALGHLHRMQETHGKQELPVRYSGSILQYSFSEAKQEKSVTLVETTNGTTTWRPITLSAGRQLLQLDAIGLNELEKRLEAVTGNEWLSINITLGEPIALDYLAKLRAAHPGILNCIPTYTLGNQQAEAATRISDLGREEQFRQFITTRFSQRPDENVVKLFLELLGEQEEPDSGGAE